MKDFPSFWAKLTENSLWFEQITVKYSRKGIKNVGEKFFIDLLARPDEFKSQNFELWRRQFQKWLMWEPDIPVAPQLQQVEKAEEVKQIIEISEEEYKRRLKEWKDIVLSTESNFKVPKLSKKQLAEEGDWVPKKQGEPYNRERQMESALEHMNTIFEAKKKEFLHFNPNATEQELKEYLDTIKIELL